MNTRYTYDSDNLVYEVLDNEVVVVNLDSGFYYIMEGTATDIWKAIVDGADLNETVAALLAIYAGDATQVQDAVRAFVGDLLQENLLTPKQAGTHGDAPVPSTPPVQPAVTNGRKPSFQNPSMLKYTDMEYLIQMDPIWEYDDAGWPKRRNFTPGT